MAFIIGAAIIGGAVGIGGALIGSSASRANANTAADASKAIATTPTRITGIDQLINDLSTTAQETRGTTLDELVNNAQQSLSTTSGSQVGSTAQQQSGSSTEQQTQQQRAQAASQNQTAQITESGGVKQGKVDTATSRGNATTTAALDNLIAGLSGGNPDTTAAVNALMSQILRKGQGGINDVAANTGTFDSTTLALLQNDLNTKAAEAGAGLQLDQNAKAKDQLLAAIGAGQAGTEATRQLSTEEQKLIESLQNQQQGAQQSNTGTVSNTAGSSNISNTGQSTSSNQETQAQNQTSQQNTAANEVSNTASTQNQTQNQTKLSDQFQNPNDANKIANTPTVGSSLGNLIYGGGVGANQATNPLVAPVSYTPAAGGASNITGLSGNNLNIAGPNVGVPGAGLAVGGTAPIAGPKPVGGSAAINTMDGMMLPKNVIDELTMAAQTQSIKAANPLDKLTPIQIGQ